MRGLIALITVGMLSASPLNAQANYIDLNCSKNNHDRRIIENIKDRRGEFQRNVNPKRDSYIIDQGNVQLTIWMKKGSDEIQCGGDFTYLVRGKFVRNGVFCNENGLSLCPFPSQ